MNHTKPPKPIPPSSIPQCIGRVITALAEPPTRPKTYHQLLDETGLPKWKFNAAIDEMLRRGIADYGYIEDDSVRAFYWLTWDPPGYPYWLDSDEGDDNERLASDDPEQEDGEKPNSEPGPQKR